MSDIIKVYLQETGTVAYIDIDFQIYKGSYRDVLIDIYVPITILPSEQNHVAGVKTALLVTKPNGCQTTTISYNAPLKEENVVFNGVTYNLYEQPMPRTYVLYSGDQTLVANVYELDTTGANLTADSVLKAGTIITNGSLLNGVVSGYQTLANDTTITDSTLLRLNSTIESGSVIEVGSVVNGVTYDEQTTLTEDLPLEGEPRFVEIVTTQTCTLTVQNSEYISNEEIDDPTQLEYLTAVVNDKQDKIDNNIVVTGTLTSSSVVTSINELNNQVTANTETINDEGGLVDRITTAESDISDIKAEQITQNTNITANTNDINGVGGNPGLKQQVAYLESVVGSGEDYIGTYTDDLDPADSDDLAELKSLLTQFVLTESGSAVEGGDVVVYVQTIASDTDKNYKFIYSGAAADWTYYEIPPVEEASNSTKGIIKGNYGTSSDKAQVNVVGGAIEDIYIIDGENTTRHLAEYINSNASQISTNTGNISQNTNDIGTLNTNVGGLQGQITSIVNGVTTVGKATKSEQDENGNNIVNTYLTQTAGVTKTQLKQYALPRAFNDVSYLTSTGYSDELPAGASPIYSETSETVGDTTLFTAEKTIVNAEFELGAKNSSSDVIYVSASGICNVQFRLTTEIYTDTWTTASVELSDNIQFTTADEIKKLQFASTFAQLTDVLKLTNGDKIRQTLEVITSVSTSLTFNVYSNETYPSTFYLNTTSQTIQVAQGDLGEILEFELNGTYNNVDDVIEYEIPEGIAINNNVMAQFMLAIPTVVLPDEITDNTGIVLKQGLQEILMFTVPTDLDGRTVPTIHDMAGVTTSNTIFFTGVFIISNGDIYLITSVTAGGSGGTVDYLDLINKPTLDTTQTTAQTTSASETITGNIKLHKISKTGTLADAIDDSTHRLVTDTQITTWTGKQDLIDNSHKLSADLVDDTSTTNKFVTSTDITNWNGKQDALSQTQLDAVNSGIDSTKVGQITTNANNISTIDGKIPAQASSSNQLADKNFVNSSIATNTANFIGTFADIPTLNAYSGTITNNDYAFVINSVIEDNGNDWATFNDLNAYDKTLLTNFDYAWVINGAKFDLYRFDIENQTWGLRVQNTAKADVTLNTAYNRYKATVSGGTTTWLFEYTLNNSSFTANQWAAINSGITDTAVAQIGTNTTDIANKMDKNNPTGTGKLSLNRLSGSTTGAYSGTVGKDNTASGTSSFAEGEANTADGSYSHAEGYQTYAGGFYSHTEGYQTYTNAHYSHAEGNNAEARGYSSHAEGYATTANNKSQHVFGEWNVIDNTGSASSRGTYVEIVGNGTASNSRSNARTLDWSGNEVLAGGLKIASTYDVVGADDVVSTTNVTPLANVARYVEDSTSTSSISVLLNTIYPVGSVRLSINAGETSFMGGTWVLVSQGRALFGAGNISANGTGNSGITYTADTTKNAELPNIKGTFSGNGQFHIGTYTGAGALFETTGSTTMYQNQTSNTANRNNGLGFDASYYNSMYKDTATVQPNAYVVYVYKRTA